MKPSLIRSYLFISLGVTLLFIALGVLTVGFIHRVNEGKNRFDDHFSPHFAKIIESSHGLEREKILSDLKDSKFPAELWFLDSRGDVLYSTANAPLPFDFKNVELPSHDLEERPIFRNGPHPRGPGPMGPPPLIIKMNDAQYSYMVIAQDEDGLKPPSLLEPLLALLITIILSSSVSVAILFLYLKKTSAIADDVLSSLRSGNLKARFPARKKNEIGSLMERFNLMADDVEGLFEKVRSKERSRIRLLQELAHDLRTPLAAIQNMLSTMVSRKNELTPETQEELFNLSLREAHYLSQLVEDLLLLSRISDIETDGVRKTEFDLFELLESEIETVRMSAANRGKNVNVRLNLGQNGGIILAEQHLLTRLWRNLFDNAFSFAKSEVGLTSEKSTEAYTFILDNDGPPFRLEDIKSFGTRRISRSLDTSVGGRISLGLGSVISKTIAELHGGEITPFNEGGRAKIKIVLKIK